MKCKERERGSYGDDTQERREAQLRYGKMKGNLGREISLGIGFGEFRGNLKDWEEDRRIMQNARWGRKGELTRFCQSFCEQLEMARNAPRDFGKDSSNLEDQALVQSHSESMGDQS